MMTPSAGSSDEFAAFDATAQAALVRDGRVTALDLVDRAIARIEKLNGTLNAVIHTFFDEARAAAKHLRHATGPFSGVPFLAKDALCYRAGDPHHQGMQVLRDLRWTEDHDSYLASKFATAGFIFLGRTNTPELLMRYTTEPLAYGPTRNPWDTALSVGGSSGGSAAAVASGMVAVAHANDWEGSIRIPASACGVVGLKPSRGRTSLGPAFGEIIAGFTTENVVCRSVRDAAAVLDAIAGPMPGDPYAAPPPPRPWSEEVGAPGGRLRIGLLKRLPYLEVHHECVRAVDEAGRLLEALGHDVEESYPRALDDFDFFGHAGVVMFASAARMIDAWEQRIGRPIREVDLEPWTRTFIAFGRSRTLAQYLEAQDHLQQFTRRVASWWASGFDLLVSPTLATVPPAIGFFDAVAGTLRETFQLHVPFAAFTLPYNITGQPAISVPLHWTGNGVPVGVEIGAAYGREDLLLRIASQLEVACAWSTRHPPLFA